MANQCLNIKMNKAVFLDRDGIINVERKDYVKTIKEFTFCPLKNDGTILSGEHV